MKQWPIPTHATDIIFLGLTIYYTRSGEGLLSIASPLTSLTLKMVKFQWSNVCGKSIIELKTSLNTTPIFTLTEGLDGCMTYCDASRVGLGFVFMQRGKVITYASREHRVHEKN